jgi:hypothetical protein
MFAPSERPGEHVMSGAPLGPGPGPEILPDQPDPTDPILYLEAAYQKSQLPEIFDLLQDARAARVALTPPEPDQRAPILPER